MPVEAPFTSLEEAERFSHVQPRSANEMAGNSDEFPVNGALVQAVRWLQDMPRGPSLHVRGGNL